MTLLKLFFVSTGKCLHLETSIFKAMMGGQLYHPRGVSSLVASPSLFFVDM